MNDAPFLLTTPIFTDPPDDLDGDSCGALLVGLGTMQTIEKIEVARSFREAADLLLKEAARWNEGWKSARPVLFCFRHALELYLKAIVPHQRNHDLSHLRDHLESLITPRYPAEQVQVLLDRIIEFHQIDPASTTFRYAESSDYAYQKRDLPIPPIELWVNFPHLQFVMGQIFDALEIIWRHSNGSTPR